MTDVIAKVERGDLEARRLYERFIVRLLVVICENLTRIDLL